MVSKHVVSLAVVIVAILTVSIVYVSVISSEKPVTVGISFMPGNPQGAPGDFFPVNFTVTEGQHVTIVFDNMDDQPHELVIPQFNVTTGIVQGDQTVRIRFVPNRIGIFEYYQPAPCHIGGALGGGGSCPTISDINGNMTVLAP